MVSVCIVISKEHLQAQGIPQWPHYASSHPYPWFTFDPASSVKKRLAGNVVWQRLIMCMFCSHDGCCQNIRPDDPLIDYDCPEAMHATCIGSLHAVAIVGLRFHDNGTEGTH